MKQSTLLRPLLGGALMLILAIPAMAQPDGRGPRDRGDGPPPRDGRGPRGPRPGGPNRAPRPNMELNRIWRDIADLEDGKLALSKAQSAQVVALVLPVSKKQTLTEADAQTLADKIEAILTDAQKAEMDADRPRGRRGGPGGPPPRDAEDGARNGRRGPRNGNGRGPDDGGRRGPDDGGRRGPRGDGPPRMSREDREKVRPFMDALNPFYPPTGYASFKTLPTEFAKDVAERYGERRALLETLSKRAKS